MKRRLHATTMHLIRPAERIRVVIVVEATLRPHPLIPLTNVFLHGLQRQHKPEPTKVRPHMLRHPILIITDHRQPNLPHPMSSKLNRPVTSTRRIMHPRIKQPKRRVARGYV